MQTIILSQPQIEHLKRDISKEILSALLEILPDLIGNKNNNSVMDCREPISKKEAAAILGIKPKSVNKRCERKQIPFHTGADGKLYFDKQELIEYTLTKRTDCNKAKKDCTA